MPTTAGIGKSTRRDTHEAAREALHMACKPLAGAEPHVLLVFATAAYRGADIMAALRETAPTATITC